MGGLGVGYIYSQIQQQVNLSMWRRQLQRAGANWEVAKAVFKDGGRSGY